MMHMVTMNVGSEEPASQTPPPPRISPTIDAPGGNVCNDWPHITVYSMTSSPACRAMQMDAGAPLPPAWPSAHVEAHKCNCKCKRNHVYLPMINMLRADIRHYSLQGGRGLTQAAGCHDGLHQAGRGMLGR